jgi:hypothetical protein
MGRGTEREASGLGEIMAALAANDGAALFALVDAHRADLVRCVRAIASSRGARLDVQQVDDLVLDAALAISEVAGAWKPDGAPPWFYARGRIAAAVDRVIGQWADPLAPDGAELAERPWSTADEVELPVLLDRLAAVDETVALVRDGLAEVASPRDLLVYVEHRVQVALGDPSPAVTVARLYGMQPAAVRQQTRRIRLRLRRLAASDPRFAPLASLPVAA